MGQFETSPEFIKDIVRLALHCLSVGSTGCTFRTPAINGECMEVDFHFKLHTEDKK